LGCLSTCRKHSRKGRIGEGEKKRRGGIKKQVKRARNCQKADTVGERGQTKGAGGWIVPYVLGGAFAPRWGRGGKPVRE